MPAPALIFDVDGTLAETEEGHRCAFNQTFVEFSIPWDWDQELYRRLLHVSGGEERMRHYAELCDPARLPYLDGHIKTMHAAKNAYYAEWLRKNKGGLRPGVRELIEAAQAREQKLGIAATTSRANLEALLDAAFGPEGRTLFAATVCGEDVEHKKPDPEAYWLVLECLDVEPADAIAFEDSLNGLKSATSAGLRTLVTPSLYTAHDSFPGAWRQFETIEVALREEPDLFL